MDFIKKNVHMNKIKEKQIMQITLDDDFNVQDVKPDIAKIIKAQARVTINDYKLLGRKLMVSGEMIFSVLYVSEEGDRGIHCITGKLPIDDSINMENASADDSLKVNAYIEDLGATMINSRKISIRAIVTMECVAENIESLEAVVGINQNEDENIQFITEDITVTQTVVNKKDICRVKEDIVLPSAKKNVQEILYTDCNMCGVDTRPTATGLILKGSIQVFVMYASESEDVEFVFKEILFNRTIEVEGCSADMIDEVKVWLSGEDVNVKADVDGEERILEFDGALSLDIKLYRECDISMVKDFYAVGKRLEPMMEERYYDTILLKNNCKMRVMDRIKIEDNKPALMQLCNSGVDIKVDEVQVVENGINVLGVAVVTLMYVTNDDDMPINSFVGMIPFSQLVEVQEVDEKSIFNIQPSLENCSVTMTDSRECEVKLVVSFNTIVWKRQKKNIIVGINELEATDEEIAGNLEDGDGGMGAMMVGYVVKENECLWDIAKRFGTTRECIKQTNFLEKDEVEFKDRLLIV